MLSAAAGGEAKKSQFLSPDWKLAGWGCSFLADIGNWLAGSGGAVSNTHNLTVGIPRGETGENDRLFGTTATAISRNVSSLEYH